MEIINFRIAKETFSLSINEHSFTDYFKKEYSAFIIKEKGDTTISIKVKQESYVDEEWSESKEDEYCIEINRGFFYIRYDKKKCSWNCIFYKDEQDQYTKEIIIRILRILVYYHLMFLAKGKTKYYALHSSGVLVASELLVFSGFSGKGKTTIAKLSESNILSDEEIILCLEDKKLYGCAFPRWDVKKKDNEIYPIKKVYFIEQGKKNTIERLRKNEVLALLSLNSMLFVLLFVQSNLKNHKRLFKKIYKQASYFIDIISAERLYFVNSYEIWKMLRN